MVNNGPEASVYVYEYGEAYDDLRPAFFIDERAYADADLAQAVVESADAAMARAGVIYAVEVTSGVHATRPIGVPTWEEFKQRHFVEGEPLPVRPLRPAQVPPPSWQAMIRAVESAHHELRTELTQLLTAALPDHQVFLSSDPGPLRRSAGSVDWSEEKFGFEFTVNASLGDLPPVEALDRVSALFAQQGWLLDDRVTQRNGVAVGGSRGDFAVWIDARPLRLAVLLQSPLYRSPAEPGSVFVVEPR